MEPAGAKLDQWSGPEGQRGTRRSANAGHVWSAEVPRGKAGAVSGVSDKVWSLSCGFLRIQEGPEKQDVREVCGSGPGRGFPCQWGSLLTPAGVAWPSPWLLAPSLGWTVKAGRFVLIPERSRNEARLKFCFQVALLGILPVPFPHLFSDVQSIGGGSWDGC